MDRSLFRSLVVVLAVLLVMVLVQTDVVGQCPMCRMAAETNLQNGGTEGRGLNKGILYILSLPYILISVIGFVWWKNRKKEETA